LITLTVVCFTLIFWGYLFALCHYIENFFLESLLTSANDSNWNERLMAAMSDQTNDTHDDVKLSMSIIEWISRILYIALPVIFSIFLSMVGYQIGNALGGIVHGWAQGPAQAGAGATKQGMGMALGQFRKLKK
jgi:hypothetical protein